MVNCVMTRNDSKMNEDLKKKERAAKKWRHPKNANH